VPYIDRVLPDGCVDIIWDGSRIFVAGPDTGPVPMAPAPSTTFIGIRFRPGRAPLALGCPASALRDQRADLAELWSAATARKTADRLAEASGAQAVRVLESAVRGRMAAADPADRVVDSLITALSAPPVPGPARVAALAAQLGVTERSLHRRCSAAVGYSPKTLDRVLRFRRALDLGRSGAATSLGMVAVTTGYADQAHFSRECRRLSGQSPSDLFKTAR
jgi:AraC-like DNA-binding protein